MMDIKVFPDSMQESLSSRIFLGHFFIVPSILIFYFPLVFIPMLDCVMSTLRILSTHPSILNTCVKYLREIPLLDRV